MAVVGSTQLLLEGRNPYAVAEQPNFLNAYGFLYNWIVLSLAWVFGGSFMVHRCVSAALLVLASWVLYSLLRASRLPRSISLVLSIILLMNLYHDVALASRPDSLVVLIVVGTAWAAFTYRFSFSVLFWCQLVSLLGFYGKAYAVLPFASISLYAFLFVNWRRALLSGALSFLAFGVSLWLIESFVYPCFITNVLIAEGGDIGVDFAHLLRHGGRFLLLNAGIMIAVLVAICGSWVRWLGGDSFRNDLQGDQLKFPIYMLVVHGLVVCWMGLHPGQGLLYYGQLLLPFFLWLLGALLCKIPSSDRLQFV